jgi:hypothetical protein
MPFDRLSPSLLLASLVLLAACAPLPQVTELRPVSVPVRVEVPVAVPVVESTDAVARRFAAYHDRIRTLSPAELQQEILRIGEPGASAAATMELATVLGYTRGNGDLVRAISLLDALLRAPAPEAAEWLPWARLLRSRYVEQRRAEENAERQAQQLRDAQRRLEQAQQQLEALKAIERSLTQRPGASPPGSADPRPTP